MRDVLELDELVDELHEGLERAADEGAPGLEVHLVVPFASQFEWEDEYGAPRSVHLPTRAHAKPAWSFDTPPPNGGPAAVFAVASGGRVPDESQLGEIARELMRRAVQWGQATYGSGDPVPDAPHLPMVFEEVVEEALGTDIRHRHDN